MDTLRLKFLVLLFCLVVFVFAFNLQSRTIWAC